MAIGETPRTLSGPIDVDRLLDSGPWGFHQKIVVLLAAMAIVLDGFDNQLLGFAVPSILRDWNLSRASLGPVFAIGLIGMIAGTAIAGYLGDRFGRRLALIASVFTFGLATLATATAQDLTALGLLRFIAGAGIGGAMPNASALSAEFTPARRRAFAVTLTIVCVPLGGALAGTVASKVLPVSGWRTLFVIGGSAALALVVLLLGALPESPRFLVRRAERWKELSRLMTRLGRATHVDSQFVIPTEPRLNPGSVFPALTARGYRRDTISLWIAFLSCLLSVYLVFNWLPALLSGEGLGLAGASSGLAAYNFGGVLGPISCGLAIQAIGSRAPMLLGSLGGALTALILIAMPPPGGAMQLPLVLALGAHGFFVNGVQTTMFALAAHIYPTRVRASGVAAASAVGRLGAIVSSFAGATLIQGGQAVYFGVLAAAMLMTFAGLAMIQAHVPRRMGGA